MAQYTHLPIYKESYRLLVLLTTKVKDFSKDYKFSIGDKIINECAELILTISRANSAVNKTSYIAEIIEKVQTIELMCRLANELHLINIPSYSETVTITDSIARQAHGWSSYSTKLTTAE